MDVRIEDGSLDRLETDPAFTAGRAPGVVKAFRKRMQTIRQAPDERVFYALRSLRFERLKGKRKHQFSMRLNDQWRLIIEFEKQGTVKRAVVKGIEDYH